MKQIVIDSLRMLQVKFGVCMIGYVIMPDHVHLLIYPHRKDHDEPIAISSLLHAFKQYVGFHGKAHLRSYWKKHGCLWSQPLTDWATGDAKEKPLWNTRGYDYNIDNEKMLIEKLNYCHKNPITRGLVEDPTEWPWSSYRFYETGDSTVLKMDWDGAWPIYW
jgi:putative transposase